MWGGSFEALVGFCTNMLPAGLEQAVLEGDPPVPVEGAGQPERSSKSWDPTQPLLD